MDQNLTDVNTRIQKALDHLKVELASVRAGRANPSLIENIPVLAYGAKMKLMEIGTIAAPQPSLLTIQVWDNSLIDTVIKAVMEANLGLNPASDGSMIRLPIPPLTQERRKEFIKLIHQKLEEAKIEIRKIRQDNRQNWVKEEELGKIGEDERSRREKILQDVIDKTMEEIENLGNKKEQELLQV